jgi:plastocyanin
MRPVMVALAALVGSLLAAAPARADDPRGRGSVVGTGGVKATVDVRRPPGILPGPVLVYLVGFEEPATKGAKPAQIEQRGKRFVPDLLGVTAGQSVTFPNADTILHNVFSPTPSRRFDLGSYRKGESRTRAFPTAGVVDVFCNIHPEMSATIMVLPNRRFGFADDGGVVSLDGVPAGTWTIFAYSRRAKAPVSAKVTVAAGATTDVAITLDEVVRDFKHLNKYGEPYREPGRYR